MSPEHLKIFCTEVVNRAKISKFEAYVILLAFRNTSKDKKKTLRTIEEEFSQTKMLPFTVIHPVLARAMTQIKGST